MHIRGALHVHSTLSHDGSLTVTELAQFYAKRRFQFVAIGEHSQDMDPAKVEALVEESAAASTLNFLVVPGIEYTCDVPGMHIFGLGAVALPSDTRPMTTVRVIHECGGFAVLAHPRRIGWQCPAELLNELDGVEVWNVGYDGKYLPSVHAPMAFRRMKQANPRLLAVAAHDLHRGPEFYDVALEMEVEVLTRDAILSALRAGAYRISSRFFRVGPRFEISWIETALLRLASAQLGYLRQARAAMRWSA